MDPLSYARGQDYVRVRARVRCFVVTGGGSIWVMHSSGRRRQRICIEAAAGREADRDAVGVRVGVRASSTCRRSLTPLPVALALMLAVALTLTPTLTMHITLPLIPRIPNDPALHTWVNHYKDLP